MKDLINSPSHYMNENGKETIDVIREMLSADEFNGYLKGNVIKYECRAGKKSLVDYSIVKELYNYLANEMEHNLLNSVVWPKVRHFFSELNMRSREVDLKKSEKYKSFINAKVRKG